MTTRNCVINEHLDKGLGIFCFFLKIFLIVDENLFTFKISSCRDTISLFYLILYAAENQIQFLLTHAVQALYH